MVALESLPLRDDLRGQSPYGAPVIDVPVRINVNENSHAVPDDVIAAIRTRIDAVLADLNRYPDREFGELRGLLAEYCSGVLAAERESEGAAQTPSAAGSAGGSVSPEMIWAANGSNEVLSHILQAFAGPGRTALGFGPSYSMHPLITRSTGADWIEVPRDADFSISADRAAAAVREHRPDVVFCCTPNNPTGNRMDLDVIEAVYDACDGVVIVDEAYAEFSRSDFRSAMGLLPGRERLVVSRTMSKAFAFAGVRLGYAIADPALIDALRLVRLPYHLSALTQAAACAALEHPAALLANVEALIAQRDGMAAGLEELGFSVVSSDANFISFGRVADPHRLWEMLVDRGVLVRDNGIPGHLRANAGTEAETTAFLEAIAAVCADAPELIAKES